MYTDQAVTGAQMQLKALGKHIHILNRPAHTRSVVESVMGSGASSKFGADQGIEDLATNMCMATRDV
jgi:hypothetical protein